MNIIDFVNGLIAQIPYVEMIPYAAIVVPAVVAIISIVLAHFGKRLLNILKFAACAGAGYYLGSVVLWTYVGEFLGAYGISNIVLGVVLAVIVALVGNFAYPFVFAGAVGYGVYLLLADYAIILDPISCAIELDLLPLHENALWIAIGIGVLALLFRGFFETVITAVGGGACFSVGIYTAIVALTDALNLGANGTGFKFDGNTPVLATLTFEMVVLVVVGVLACLGGFVKQVKNRHRF
jgi:hypothetical protein